MIRFISRHSKRIFSRFCLRILAIIGLLCVLPWKSQSKSQVSFDSVQISAQWRTHEAAAQAALHQASECLTKALKLPKGQCEAELLLKKAENEYNQMQRLLGNTGGHVEEAIVVANGFLRSGAVARAIEFLITHPKTSTDPFLSHLLADALFAVGDHPNAALAYKTWISMGCGGYLYSMQSNAVWIVPKTGDRCSHLPSAIRSRLEMLQETSHGEPSNLPEYNDPTGNFVAH